MEVDFKDLASWFGCKGFGRGSWGKWAGIVEEIVDYEENRLGGT